MFSLMNEEMLFKKVSSSPAAPSGRIEGNLPSASRKRKLAPIPPSSIDPRAAAARKAANSKMGSVLFDFLLLSKDQGCTKLIVKYRICARSGFRGFLILGKIWKTYGNDQIHSIVFGELEYFPDPSLRRYHGELRTQAELGCGEQYIFSSGSAVHVGGSLGQGPGFFNGFMQVSDDYQE